MAGDDKPMKSFQPSISHLSSQAHRARWAWSHQQWVAQPGRGHGRLCTVPMSHASSSSRPGPGCGAEEEVSGENRTPQTEIPSPFAGEEMLWPKTGGVCESPLPAGLGARVCCVWGGSRSSHRAPLCPSGNLAHDATGLCWINTISSLCRRTGTL